MSLTAIFAFAPVRDSVVGPSLDTAQIFYSNPGIALTIFDVDAAKARFTALMDIAMYIAAQNRIVRTYASVSQPQARTVAQTQTIMTSYADSAIVPCTSDLPARTQTPTYVVQVASAKVQPTPKKPVSIEVTYA